MIAEVRYKNLDFDTRERIAIMQFKNEDDLREQVFNQWHMYNGNHMEGHGRCTIRYRELRPVGEKIYIEFGSMPTDEELLAEGWSEEQVKNRGKW